MVLFYVLLLSIPIKLLSELTDQQRAKIAQAIKQQDTELICGASLAFTRQVNFYSHAFGYDAINAIGLAVIASCLETDFDAGKYTRHACTLLRDDESCQTVAARQELVKFRQKNARDRQKDTALKEALYPNPKTEFLKQLLDDKSPDTLRATAMIVALDVMNPKAGSTDKYRALLYGGEFTLADKTIFGANPDRAIELFKGALSHEPFDIHTRMAYTNFMKNLGDAKKERRMQAAQHFAQEYATSNDDTQKAELLEHLQDFCTAPSVKQLLVNPQATPILK